MAQKNAMDDNSYFSDRRQVEDDATVVSRYLPAGYTAEPQLSSSGGEDGSRSSSEADPISPRSDPIHDSLTLQGGDVHREIFKIGARAKLHQRANTFAQPSMRRSSTFAADISASEQRAPGGFRRQFFERQQDRLHSVTRPVTKNFVSFLELYGSFAGEELVGSDEDSTIVTTEDEAEDAERAPTETRPLLGHRKSTRRSVRAGDAGTTRTFFTLLKAFVGTGIMFLPKAFRNGGILFSSVTLVFISLISCLCFRLLLDCRSKLGGGGYGELGAAIGGPRLRNLILGSITISQIGFVCTGVIFFAENIADFLERRHAEPQSPVKL